MTKNKFIYHMEPYRWVGWVVRGLQVVTVRCGKHPKCETSTVDTNQRNTKYSLLSVKLTVRINPMRRW